MSQPAQAAPERAVLDRVGGAAAREPGAVAAVRERPATTAGAFADVLAARLGEDGIRLSAHAEKRLRQSDLAFDPNAATRLSDAVGRAEQKGARDSLILLDDLAFIVSVKNKMVITAVEGGRAREGVFTNIDSVVIG